MKASAIAALLHAKSVELQKILAEVAEDSDYMKSTLLKGATQADRQVELTALMDEIESLKSDHAQAVRIEKAQAENDQRIADYKQPANDLKQPRNTTTGVVGNDGSPQRKSGMESIEFPVHSSLHFLKGETRQEALEKAYRLGQWYLATVHKSQAAIQFCTDHGVTMELDPETKVHSEGSNVSSAILVPNEFGTDIIDLREQFGVFRRNARIVPMKHAVRTDPRRKAGLTAYFAGEGDAATESQKSWDEVKLELKKIMSYALFSSELNEDSVINIGDDLAGEMAYAFSYKEDECGFIGTGTAATYGGIVGITERLKTLYGTSGGVGLIEAAGDAYSEITLQNIIDVVAALPEYAEAGAKIYCSKTFWASVLVRLALSAGGVTAAEIFSGGRTRTFMQYPVEIVQVMSKTRTNADAHVPFLLGNLRLSSSLGTKRQMSIAFSVETGTTFINDQIAVRGLQRFDIQNHSFGTSTEAGPMVGLIMKSE